jgi:hypothetical protein
LKKRLTTTDGNSFDDRLSQDVLGYRYNWNLLVSGNGAALWCGAFFTMERTSLSPNDISKARTQDLGSISADVIYAQQ